MKLLSLFTGCTAISISGLLGASIDDELLSPMINAPNTKPIPGNTPVEQCDTDMKQYFEFTDLTLDPELPEAGKNLTITAAGILKIDVTDGAYVDVVASYGLITLLRQRYDMCENLGEVDLECPVAPGEVSIEKVVQMPDTLPPGQYSVLAKAYTKNDELLSCLTAQVALGY